MTQQQRLYPIGIQTFSELITKNYLYIDKTEYVYRMTHFDSKYNFFESSPSFWQKFVDFYPSSLF